MRHRSDAEASLLQEIETALLARPNFLRLYDVRLASAERPDIVGVMAPDGLLIFLDVRLPGGPPDASRTMQHLAWRRFGMVVRTVSSVSSTWRALQNAGHEAAARA